MPGPVSFLQLLYRLVKARGGKAGRHAYGRSRDGVCCREIRHAHIEGHKAPHVPYAHLSRFKNQSYGLDVSLPLLKIHMNERWARVSPGRLSIAFFLSSFLTLPSPSQFSICL